MDDLKEIGVIWQGETARALKTGRVLVLLVLFLLFVGMALAGIGLFSSQVMAQASAAAPGVDPAKLEEALVAQKMQFLAVFFGDDKQLLEAFAKLPLVLLAVFKLTLRFVPLFIALMGFDQIAEDLGLKSMRYLAVRARRDSIVLGKFLSQATLFSGLLAVCTVVMVLGARLFSPDFAVADMAVWTLKLVGSSVVLALAYLALTTLCSAVTRSGPVALVLNIIVLFVIWLLAFVGEYYRLPGDPATGAIAMMQPESWLGLLRYVSVWHFGQDLLHPGWRPFAAAAIMHLGFAATFLGLAQLALKRRDL